MARHGWWEVTDAAARQKASGERVWTGAARLDSVADVSQVLHAVNARAAERARTREAPRLVERAAETSPDSAVGYLPVAEDIASLLAPWVGLKRGTAVTVPNSLSLVCALIGGAQHSTDSWCAVVDLPALNPLAVHECGGALERLALVPDTGSMWAKAIGTVIDGIDLVVTAPPRSVPAGVVKSVMARVRQRGAVLIVIGGWPGAEVILRCVGRRPYGIRSGHGRLRGWDLRVEASGRGGFARPRQATIRYPLTPHRVDDPEQRVWPPRDGSQPRPWITARRSGRGDG